MKKIVTILIALLVGVNVYAVDVSDFDIKGIKLGDSYLSVKNILHTCKVSKEYVAKTNDKKKIFQIEISFECKNNNFYKALFNRNRNLMMLQRFIMLDTKPNLQQIKNKIIKKYKTPTGKSKFYNPEAYKHRKYTAETLCWGTTDDCKINIHPNLKGTLVTDISARRNKSFTFEITGPTNSGYNLWFLLWDSKLVKENEKWTEQRNKHYDIDL